MKELGYANSVEMNRMDLLKLQGALHAKMAQGERDMGLLKSLSLLAEVMKTQHALELLETQGITALQKYFDKLQQESIHTNVKAVKNLVIDTSFKTAMHFTAKLMEEKVEHLQAQSAAYQELSLDTGKDSLEKKFAELEASSGDLEVELLELKKRAALIEHKG